MRIILTGGCTGGHIYPALAIGDKFKEMRDDCEIIFVAHAHGLETTIVPKAGYELRIVTADWFDRSRPITIPRTLKNTADGTREALKIMKEFKPDIVISTGSFVSVPVVRAGALYGASIYIQEQNAFPGLSNKLLSKYAKNVFLGFEDGRSQFREPDKCIYSGNPVRAEFSGRDRLADRKELGIPADDIVIMAFGGSLGSAVINDIGLELIKKYSGMQGVSLIFGTGRNYYDALCERIKAEGIELSDNIHMSAYIDGMPRSLSSADIVISRSGALSVAEITMCKRAAIFVPSPNVTADHQYYNAKAVADVGGALLFRENEGTKAKVIKAVAKLKDNPQKIREMELACGELAPTKATEIIYNKIMKDYEGN